MVDFDIKVYSTAYFITYFNLKVAGKHILLCIESILLFRLIVYVLVINIFLPEVFCNLTSADWLMLHNF